MKVPPHTEDMLKDGKGQDNNNMKTLKYVYHLTQYSPVNRAFSKVRDIG